MNKTAFIFPAFGIDFFGNEDQILYKYSKDIKPYLESASSLLNLDFKSLLSGMETHADELNDQYLVYIYSAAFSDLLKEKKTAPFIYAGYSMGIYAALYGAGSVSFEDGLLLIKNAFEISRSTLSRRYAMAITIGLEKHDLVKIINTNCREVEIINQNNKYAMIIAGIDGDINFVLDECLKEGALKVKKINAKVPYHSKVMKEASSAFGDYLNTVKINDPSVNLISCVDRSIIASKKDIIRDLINNIGMNISWLLTFESLLSMGCIKFIECGPGDSLNKISKFIDGDFKVYSMNKIDMI